MYLTRIPNRGSPPAVLLRESYREGGKVKTRTLANLSKLPAQSVEAIKRALRGERLVAAEQAWEINRSLPHGHVAAVLGTLRTLDLERTLSSRASRERDVAVALLVSRLIEPSSKFACAQALRSESAFHSLGELVGLQELSDREVYRGLDWLLERKDRIEAKLAERHLADGAVVLYDVTSTYFEGECCPLAAWGHNRDGKRGKRQIGIGLLTTREGCPVAVEVFPGNLADPSTVAVQLAKLRERFGLGKVILVGDRGMLTNARISAELRGQEDLEWISALRGPAIKKLIEQDRFAPELFDDWGLAEISSDSYPGERLVVCKNPLLASERRRKREELLQATEAALEEVRSACRRASRPLRGKHRIGVRLGKVVGRYKMAKHFILDIREDGFDYRRKEESVREEQLLDGFYIVRTSLSAEEMDGEQVVRTYKGLSAVERAFRTLKTTELEVRPIFHRLADRVCAHVFLCMLAYYVEWHMRRALAPLLFDDEYKEQARAEQPSVVAPARRSPHGNRKAGRKRTEADEPVHSFPTLLKDLATLTKNWARVNVDGAEPFVIYATPTPLQQRAFDLLGVSYRM